MPTRASAKSDIIVQGTWQSWSTQWMSVREQKRKMRASVICENKGRRQEVEEEEEEKHLKDKNQNTFNQNNKL